jgi:alginate O-acetyltransferase complex protein AlgI
MVFSTPEFFAFFAIYFFAHFFVPKASRNWLIIIGGSAFYMYWKAWLVWLPFALVLTAFFGVLWIARSERHQVRRFRLTMVVIAMFMPLVAFKYTNFLYQQFNFLTGASVEKIVDLPLPLGISFITFTLIAYVVDVYRGKFPVEKKLSVLTSYVVFFPHLIAGPILRPGELIPQLRKAHSANLSRIGLALAIFTIGLFKKLFFADQIGAVIDPHYIAVPDDSLSTLLAIYGFSIQIYCDFSGYTDMAIGLAMMLGVRLPNNFKRPYSATSVVDFWQRWHITLSHWLRDYLYIPLGGNRNGQNRQTGNIFITMLIGGLWHGANWTFVVWGGIHAIGIAFNHWFRRVTAGRTKKLMPRWLAVFLTFHFVTIAWVFFRSPDFGTAIAMLERVIELKMPNIESFAQQNAWILVLFALFMLFQKIDTHFQVRAILRQASPLLVYPVMTALFLLSIAISTGSSAAFIYFDF